VSSIEVVVLILSLEGLLFVVLGRAMTNVAPNRFVGIRYPATFADARVWRETHVRYGPMFARIGWLILVGGLVIVALPLSDALTLSTYLVLSLGGLGWYIWDSWRFANRRLRHYRALDASSEG